MEAKERKEEDPQIIAGKLFDSVRDTLLKQGVLQRMKAELRAAVLTAIVSRRGEGADPMPLYDQLSEAEDDQTRAIGTLTLFLVKDALEALNLPFTLSILIQEAGMDHVTMERDELAAHLGMSTPLHGRMFSDNRLGSIVSALLAQRIFEPVTDEYGGFSRTATHGMQEYDDEYAGDGHDGEYEEGDGEEYGGAIALSLAETTQKSLEGYISRADREPEVPDTNAAVDRQGGSRAQQARLPPLRAAAYADKAEDEEDDFAKNFDASHNADDQHEFGFDSQVGQRVTVSNDQHATKRIDLTQRLRLSKEDQLMLEQALGDDIDGDQDDADYEFEPQTSGISAAQAVGSESVSPAKRGFITPDEYKSTMSRKSGNQQQSNQQFEEDDVFSDVDESLEGSSPIADSHDLNELSGLGRSRQSEGADIVHRMQDSNNPQQQDEVDGFVDLAQREEEDEDAGAEAGEGAGAGAGEGAGEGAGTRTTRPTTHHEPGQEPEQDEFQDLESVGQQDDLYDFDDHKYIEESDHFGTPSADKFDESLHDDQPDSEGRQANTNTVFREARDDILATQSADNYDEDFEVEEEEVASAVSANPENVDISDFSAGGESDHEDSDF